MSSTESWMAWTTSPLVTHRHDWTKAWLGSVQSCDQVLHRQGKPSCDQSVMSKQWRQSHCANLTCVIILCFQEQRRTRFSATQRWPYVSCVITCNNYARAVTAFAIQTECREQLYRMLVCSLILIFATLFWLFIPISLFTHCSAWPARVIAIST